MDSGCFDGSKNRPGISKSAYTQICHSFLKKCLQLLPVDDRGLYESSLSGLKSSALTALPCVVTGYPVLTGSGRSPVTFTKPGRVANREDWIVLNKAAKEAGGSHLSDVLTYLSAWCGTATMYTF